MAGWPWGLPLAGWLPWRGVNFIGNAVSLHVIYGTISDAQGNPIKGVTVSDGAGHSAISAYSGDYIITNISSGAVTITPSKQGYTFNPPSWSGLISTSVPNINFVGTASFDFKLSITAVFDTGYGRLYPSPQIPNTVDGNKIEVKVQLDYVEALPGTKQLYLVDDQTGKRLGSFDLPAITGTGIEIKTFLVDTYGWSRSSDGTRAYQRTVTAQFVSGTGTTFISNYVTITINPRPVVLVHGWNDTETTWDDYIGKGGYLDQVGLKGFAAKGMLTGGENNQVGPTNTIDKNASVLEREIQDAKRTYHAAMVDVIGHSMGGLITRRYISTYMSKNNPDVNQLIMIATPNAGSNSAELAITGVNFLGTTNPLSFWASLSKNGVKYPATLELQPSSVRKFNEDNRETYKVPRYVIAGNAICYNLLTGSFSNFVEGYPNDLIVGKASAFAITRQGSWVYKNSPSCGAWHNGLIHDGIDPKLKLPSSGADVFATYVKPLLLQPTKPSYVSPRASSTSAVPRQEIPAETQPDLLQFTDVQTGTVKVGAPVTFTQRPESGDHFTFVVIGPPDQIDVRLTAPNGTQYLSTTVAADMTYMRMSEDMFPLTTYTITNADPGAWTITVASTANTPIEGVTVASFGTLTSPLQLDPILPDSQALILQPLAVRASLTVGGAPLAATRVFATVTGGLEPIPLEMFDDGAHADGAANDGVYGNSFVPTKPGVYAAAIRADGTHQGNTFARSRVWSTEVKGFQTYLPLSIR